MKNLFIDTNIWLSLYHFTNDDLSQFEKLQGMLGKSINLLVPQQVFDEILRNRETKLKDALKDFEFKSPKYPAFCKGYKEYEQLSKDISKHAKRFSEWKSLIDLDIQNQDLPADKTIQTLFSSVSLIPCDCYIEKAYNRYRIGNPPGKDNKYGDAINWECLLDCVTNGEDLYFISADKDYHSLMSDKNMNPFLVHEWETSKHSRIFFYSNLVGFLNEHAKDIKLESESEKQKLIEDLCNSWNFQTTHGIIAMLGKYTGWTETQIEDICHAAEHNSQVNWILEDDDVKKFYYTILSEVNYEEINDSSTKRIIDFYGEKSIQKMQEAQFDHAADVADALEESYNH